MIRRHQLIIMKRWSLLAVVVAQACAQNPPPLRGSSGAPTAYVGARVFTSPGAAPIENGVILVVRGRIAAVGPASTGCLNSSDCIGAWGSGCGYEVQLTSDLLKSVQEVACGVTFDVSFSLLRSDFRSRGTTPAAQNTA